MCCYLRWEQRIDFNLGFEWQTFKAFLTPKKTNVASCKVNTFTLIFDNLSHSVKLFWYQKYGNKMGVEFRSLTSLDFSDSDMHTWLVRKSIAFVQLLYALISILQHSCTLCRYVITTGITSFHLYGTRTKLQNQFWYNLFIFLVLSLSSQEKKQ